MRIAVGGIAGFADLARPAMSDAFRQETDAALYIHDYVWSRTDSVIRRAILDVFNAPADVEFGLVADAETWFASAYRTEYEDLGVRPGRGHVNLLSEQLAADWKPFVDAARRRGFKSIAPVITPNEQEFVNNPFESKNWQVYRDAASYGGGLTVDSPAEFFLNQPEAYRTFVVQEVQWARSMMLHTSFIISPGGVTGSFTQNADDVINHLVKNNGLPDEVVVENYSVAPSADGGRPTGNQGEMLPIIAAARSIARRLNEA